MSDFKTVPAGITAPHGFTAAGVACGIKKSENKDLALIYSEALANAAGVFTSNQVKSATVILSQEQVRIGQAQAILINSGNANTCTGKRGVKDAEALVDAVAGELNVSPRHVLLASTGKIGVPLPMRNIHKGIREIRKRLSKGGGHEAAEAILTTDTRTKEVAIEVPLGVGQRVVIGGMAKGAGMISPHLATMLGFITTDAVIRIPLLKLALKEAVDRSFNMIVVDRDMSTNDTVFVLANGMARNTEIKKGSKSYKIFQRALERVCVYLAKEIARDGEGATKLIDIRVVGAKSEADARKVAKAVVGSNLLKAAMFGEDPNWGRIMTAIGYSGAKVDPNRVAISIWREPLVRKGALIPYDRQKIKKVLSGPEIQIKIDLGIGKGEATAWGCDLSYDYVKINARYHV